MYYPQQQNPNIMMPKSQDKMLLWVAINSIKYNSYSLRPNSKEIININYNLI